MSHLSASVTALAMIRKLPAKFISRLPRFVSISVIRVSEGGADWSEGRQDGEREREEGMERSVELRGGGTGHGRGD